MENNKVAKKFSRYFFKQMLFIQYVLNFIWWKIAMKWSHKSILYILDSKVDLIYT